MSRGMFSTSVDDIRRQGGLVEMRDGVLEISVDASELRLGVGEWPTTVSVLVGRYLQDLEFKNYDVSEGDIQGANYASKDDRMRMLIIND